MATPQQRKTRTERGTIMVSTMRTNSDHREPEGPDTVTRTIQNNNNTAGQQGQHKMTNTRRKQQARKTRMKTRRRTGRTRQGRQEDKKGKDDDNEGNKMTRTKRGGTMAGAQWTPRTTGTAAMQEVGKTPGG